MDAGEIGRILELKYLGNSVQAYLEALGLIVGITLVVWILERIVVSRLHRLATRTETRVDDYLVEIVQGLGVPVYAFIGLYLASQSLVLSKSVERIIHIAFVVFVTIKIVQTLGRFATYLIARSYARMGEADPNRDSVVRNLGLVVRGLLWAIGVVFLLDNMGIRVTGVVAGLGIGGVAVALAAQAVLQDTFSSFCIYLDRPFEIGDFIIVGDFLGSVEHIGFKTTRIRSLGGEQLIFANKDLTDSRVRNYKRMQERRILFALGVTYQTPFAKMQKIPGMIREIIESAKDTRFDRAHFKSYGAYSLDLEIVYYVLSPDYNKYMDVQQEINFRIMEAFEREGIEFAYPTQTLFVERDGGDARPGGAAGGSI